MPTYLVQMQTSDGEIAEREITVGWDAEKVPPEEVARACAAMVTCEHGWTPAPSGGTMPRKLHVGLSAVLLSPEEELAQLAGA